MPTYIIKTTDTSGFLSGADFSREVSTGTETADSISVTIASSGTEDSYAVTASGVPNSVAWEDTDHTIEVNVTSSNSKIDLQMAVARVDSGGTIQQTGSFTAVQTLNPGGVKNYTVSSPGWTSEVATDRIVYVYRFVNTDTMNPQGVTIETGTTDTEHVSPITEDVTGDKTVTPSVLTITSSVQAPVISIDELITVSVLTLTSSLQAPAVSITESNLVGVLTLTASVQSPTILLGTTISPSVLSIVSSIQAPTINTESGGITVMVSVLSLSASLISPKDYVTGLQFVTTTLELVG